MSDMNIALTNSVGKIELDVTEINQILAALSDQFKNQFARNITDEDVSMIQKSFVEQSARDRITESVKRSQVIEYPDQLGKRTIDPNSEEFKGKKVSNRLKSLARSLKHDLIDLDQPDVLKNWKDIPENDRDFYMLRLEKLANDKGFKIYQCKRMWCAKSLLRESFKSDNQTHRRRNQQDPDSSGSINDAFEDVGRDESPIIADVVLQITMIRVYSPFKITESVNKYVGFGRFYLYQEIAFQKSCFILIDIILLTYRLFIRCTSHSNDDILGTLPVKVLRESKNIITATFTSQENGSCEGFVFNKLK
ncbi:uncharacterized protein EV154DRAFT_488603 [Mucor mucedo]|uniref:uncharacterized protein n=1 Tax=Mucor mucedo TaxID=29922 RepID=UPI00222063CB|nr:uncharacterized protein EV154DRAFT_488603 [Mucor mucedo]KAI7866111.1 hypothetical protein EV154DRAFT_488603 [Mucor mucedo]